MTTNPTNPTPTPNFQRIETVTGGYFPYIVGRFHQPGVYVLGVMDLNDPASWSGGESTVTYQFLITPEEFGWLSSDRARLDKLAQDLQTNMPRSRFFSAMSKGKADPAQLREQAENALKSEALENDQVFEAWKKSLNFQRVVKLPATPINMARHKLAVAQKGYDPRTAAPEKKEEVERLERELGWMLLKAEELYVAYDASYDTRWPFLETARGNAHIFTSEQYAKNAQKYYEQANLFYSEVRRIQKEDIKAFFRGCEELGILRFRVDDGVEPVEVWRRNIIPDSPLEYLERKNQSVRNVTLRTLQSANLLAKHGEQMEEKWKKSNTNWFLTWQRNMLQGLANTLFYVPVALPQQMAANMPGPIYTKRSMEKLKAQMEKDKAPSNTMHHPGFKGRVFTVDTTDKKLPLRLMKNNETEKFWLLAFTSRALAENFITQSKQQDTVVILSFDELTEQLGESAGIAVDINKIGLQLGQREIKQMLSIRSQPKVVFRSDVPQGVPPEKIVAAEQILSGELPLPAESEQAEPEQPEVEPAEPKQAEPVETEPEQTEPEQAEPEQTESEAADEEPNEEEPRKGFWGKLFGKK